MAPITGVNLGFLVGFIPTASMTLASILLSSITVHSLVEASVQNFAAGLILSAVAAELFPLMIGEDVTTTDSMIGVTVGFAVGLTILNSVETIVGYVISFVEKAPEEGSMHSQSRRLSAAERKKTDIPFNEVDEPELTMELKAIKKARKPRSGSGSDNGLLKGDDIEDEGEWEDEPVHMSHVALSVPSHRQHLEEHMREMYDCVVDMENKAIHLLTQHNLSQKDVETVAEEIDEAVHTLHYKLDHCKRLLQGSEIEIHMTATTGAKDAVIVPLNSTGSWVTEAKKHRIKGRLAGLKATVQHLVDHILEANIDKSTLTEMHEHMEHMESQLTMFHDTVEKASAKWRRCRPTTMPITELGDTVPIDLVIPVTMDCFIDGFLIGVTCSIAPTAGIILGAANCLEMVEKW
jgi:zinc transporter ZupT